jgi:hypothetical protein
MLTSEVEGIGNEESENRGGDKVMVYEGLRLFVCVCKCVCASVCVWGRGGWHEREQEREMCMMTVKGDPVLCVTRGFTSYKYHEKFFSGEKWHNFSFITSCVYFVL